jgi:plastocyanin
MFGKRLLLGALLAATLSVALTAAACGDDDDSGATTGNLFVVQISDNMFTPSSLTVPTGTTVKWSWSGKNSHSIVGTFGDQDLSSAQHKGSGTFTFKMVTAGTWSYHCGVHGDAMAAKIIVK